MKNAASAGNSAIVPQGKARKLNWSFPIPVPPVTAPPAIDPPNFEKSSFVVSLYHSGACPQPSLSSPINFSDQAPVSASCVTSYFEPKRFASSSNLPPIIPSDSPNGRPRRSSNFLVNSPVCGSTKPPIASGSFTFHPICHCRPCVIMSTFCSKNDISCMAYLSSPRAPVCETALPIFPKT